MTAVARGETFTADQQTDAFRAALGRLAGSLAPGSPLRANFDAMLADYDRLKSKEVMIRFR